MLTWRTKLQLWKNNEVIITDAINISRGIFQGDTLSPLLFCIGYFMVSQKLKMLRIGYVPGIPGKRDPSNMRSHFVFMDDFKGMTTNEASLGTLMKTCIEILKELGLEVGLNKCAVMKVKRGKVENMEGLKLDNDHVINNIDEGLGYAYLGILQILDPCHNQIKKTLLSKVENCANEIWKSNLTEQNKVKAHNMFVISKLNYSFGVIKWTKFELDEIDRKMRKIIAKYACMNLHSNTDRLYLNRKKGGKGLLNIHHMHNRTLCSLVTYIFNAKSVHAKLIKEFWISKSDGTLLKKAEDIIFNANINVSFTRTGTIYESSLIDSNKVSKLLKTTYEKQYQHSWLSSSLHGKILKGCIDSGADVQSSFQWLMSSNLRGEAASSIFAIQEQMIATRVIRKRI